MYYSGVTRIPKATVTANVLGIRTQTLIDTGSSISFMDEGFFKLYHIKKKPSKKRILMASPTFTSQVEDKLASLPDSEIMSTKI